MFDGVVDIDVQVQVDPHSNRPTDPAAQRMECGLDEPRLPSNQLESRLSVE